MCLEMWTIWYVGKRNNIPEYTKKLLDPNKFLI